MARVDFMVFMGLRVLWFVGVDVFVGEKGGGGGVVVAVVGADDGATGVGVAVGAEVGAGVVHADVLGGDAAAGGALAFVLEGFGGGSEGFGEEGMGGWVGEGAGAEVVEEGTVIGPEAGDEVAVDAAVVGDAVAVEVEGLGAGGEGDGPAVGVPGVAETDEALDEFLSLGGGGLGGEDVVAGEAAGLADEVGLHLAVGGDVDEAEHEFVGVAPEAVADVPYAGEELAGREGGGEDDGVKSPDDALVAEEGGEAEEGVNACVEGRDVELETFRLVVVEGELEVVVDAPAVELGEVGDEGRGVLAPEDDDSHPLEGNPGEPLVEGVAPKGVAFPQAAHEPVGVEGRDVRGTAHREDDGGLDGKGVAVLPLAGVRLCLHGFVSGDGFVYQR